jgi:pyrroline-5-carboxylate reductase
MRKTLTFIGNGAMALSMAQGLRHSCTIEVVGRNPEHLDRFEKALGVTVGKAPLEGFDITGKTVLLCVKPANIASVGTQLKGHADVLYSVLAGTSLHTLQQHISASAVVRAMPNLAATVGRSMTTLTGETSKADEAAELFGAIGTTLWLGSEKELDIATALAGSGPAYLAVVAEALADGAVREGLRRDDAMALMRGLFGGFGELIAGEHPALLKDGVMSPGGTTAAGYAALEEGKVRSAFMAAVSRAYERARALS